MRWFIYAYNAYTYVHVSQYDYDFFTSVNYITNDKYETWNSEWSDKRDTSEVLT